MAEYEIITRLMQREGWDIYTDHPADKGGPTKWGITLLSLARYLKRPPAIDPSGNLYPGIAITAADIKALTETEARKFYRFVHVIEPKFHLIEDPALREIMVDAGVNHGPQHPIKWAQAAAEVAQDGILGPVSLAAINAAAPLEIFLWVASYRIRLYGRLTSQDPVLKQARAAGLHLQAEFTAGWCNRIGEFLEAAARDIEAEHKHRQKEIKNGQ